MDNRKEKTLLDKVHKKLINQLKDMGIEMDDFNEKRKYLVSAPMLGHMYLLIKVHKKNFPGRAVVSQVNDPTYKICKILTDILNPIAKNGQSYVENSYDLKQFLGNLNVDEYDIQASFDIVALYPSSTKKIAQQHKFIRTHRLEDRGYYEVIRNLFGNTF